ncbi:LOW QUALITY PROTEIN: Hypothetical protein PHPALM_11188, partial [Phytophthora palmivora]
MDGTYSMHFWWVNPRFLRNVPYTLHRSEKVSHQQKFYPIVAFAACFSLQRSMPMVFRGYHESAVWLNNSFDVIANAYRDVWLDIKLLNRCPRLERTSRVKKTLLSDRGRYSDIIRPQIGYVSQAKSLDQFMVLSELIRQICANLGEDGYAQCGSSGVVSNQNTIEAQHRAIKSTAVNNLHATTGHVLASTLPKFLVECTTDFGSDPIRHYESESEIVEKALNLCEDANHYKRHARKSQRASVKIGKYNFNTDYYRVRDDNANDLPVSAARSKVYTHSLHGTLRANEAVENIQLCYLSLHCVEIPHSESETPPARPGEEQYHVFDGVSGRQVKAGAVTDYYRVRDDNANDLP